MDLATFINQKRPHWKQLESVLARVEGSGLGALEEDQAVEFGRLYRSAASDLNQAQTFISGDATVHYLNDLVARCYVVIYANTQTDLRGTLRYLFYGYPAVFRRHVRLFLLAAAILAGGTLFGYLAMLWDPDNARAFLMPANFPTIEPDSEGHAMSTGELTQLSSFYFVNNTSVTLVVFALGITFGLGTAWMLWTTGIMTGVLLAAFVQAGQLAKFCAEILPHGVVEIPAILIGGAAGFLLARGMIHGRPWPRREELARAGKEALLLVAGCVPLLAAAALLEAVVARAPSGYIAIGLKLAVAGIVGLLFLVYVALVGAKKPPLDLDS
jgi:uncharacterized membrane protein SpoIIM required for sporulation